MSEEDTSKVKKDMWQRKAREGFMEEVTFAQALKFKENFGKQRGGPSACIYGIDQIPPWPCAQSHGVYRPWVQNCLVSVLVLPLTSCMTLHNKMKLSDSQSPHLGNRGNNNSVYLW